MGVLTLFGTFYVDAPIGIATPGDIYWVPVPETAEVPRVLDVRRTDPRVHDKAELELVEVGGRHFTNRDERLPLKLAALGSSEELIASKGKRRPVIVLFEAPGCDLTALQPAEQRLARSLGKGCYVVAPMYSTATINDPGTFMPTMVARIRALQYPHFTCLPELGKNEAVPGEIVRLDRVFATYLGRGSHRSPYKLHEEVFQLVLDQLVWSATGKVSEYLHTVADAVRDSVPGSK